MVEAKQGKCSVTVTQIWLKLKEESSIYDNRALRPTGETISPMENRHRFSNGYGHKDTTLAAEGGARSSTGDHYVVQV